MENMNWAIGILEWIPAEHTAGDDFDEDVYLKSDVLKAMAKYSDEKIDAVIDFMKEKDRFTYRNTDSKWTLFGEILNKLQELKDGCGECEDYAEWDGHQRWCSQCGKPLMSPKEPNVQVSDTRDDDTENPQPATNASPSTSREELAIGFAEWLPQNAFNQFEANEIHYKAIKDGEWLFETTGGFKTFTTTELLHLYQQHLNKQ